MKRATLARSILVGLGLIGGAALLRAGPLNPPGGAVSSTYKTLSEVEPRIAINSTNTPGDANSVFRIVQPGSYYLTGNLTGVSGKHGIEIAANAVTIDLNGFDVQGVAGSLSGIIADTPADNDLAVLNGTIRNWGDAGVNFFFSQPIGCRVENVLASGNGSTGIVTSSNAAITNCVAQDNVGSGISISSGVISGCSAYSNAGTAGISPGSGSTVTDSSAIGNAGIGISAGSGTTVTRCTARANGTSGISTSSSCLVTDCDVTTNSADGIRCAGSGSIIRGNVCASNGLNAGDGAGIAVVSIDNRIEGNHCTGGDRGIDVSGTGNLIVRNTCANNTTNWVIVAGNSFGPIVVAGTNGAPVSGNSASGTLGNTDPNANFTY